MLRFECPICHKTLTVERKEDALYRPFCGERCKMVDLGRWLDGTYSISEDITAPPLADAERRVDGPPDEPERMP